MMNRGNFVMEVLDEIIPNPVCELRYSKDYELLIAVMLSAQCTDKRVNMVTGVLFVILLFITISLTVIVSGQKKKITLLIQEVSILKNEINKRKDI